MGWLRLIADMLAGLFKSPARLQAEILVLRHQLAVLHRTASKRPGGLHHQYVRISFQQGQPLLHGAACPPSGRAN